MTLESLSKTAERPVSTCPYADECAALEGPQCRYLLARQVISNLPITPGSRRKLIFDAQESPELRFCPRKPAEKRPTLPRQSISRDLS